MTESGEATNANVIMMANDEPKLESTSDPQVVVTNPELSQNDLPDEDKDETNLDNPGDADDIAAKVPNNALLQQLKQLMDMDENTRNKLLRNLAASNQINPNNKSFAKVEESAYDKLKRKKSQLGSLRLSKGALASERKKKADQMKNQMSDKMGLNNAIGVTQQMVNEDSTEQITIEPPTKAQLLELSKNEPLVEPIQTKSSIESPVVSLVEPNNDKSEEKVKLTAAQRRQRRRRQKK